MKKLYVFKRLFQYTAPHRVKLLMVAALSLVGVVFEVLKPFPVKLVIDNVLSDKKLPAILKYILNGDIPTKEQLLIGSIIFMIVIAVVGATISFITFNATVKLAQKIVYDLSVDFFSKLQRLSLSFYSRNQVGDLLQRMSEDVYVGYYLVAQLILPVVTSLVCLAVMFTILIKLDLILGLIAFSVVPLLSLALALFARPMNDTTLNQYYSHGRLASFVQQSLLSIRIIQAFGRESFMSKKVKEHAQTFSKAYTVANRVSMTYNQVTVLITGIVSAILIGIGGFRVLHGMLSLGDLFIFLGYITAMYGPVNALSTAIGAAVTIGARGKRIFEILDSREVVKEMPDAQPLIHSHGAIEFRGVSFGYGEKEKGARTILENISFEVAPGEVVAIVGPTGTGKTSLISLLARFYDPWNGNIYLDGKDISEVQLHSLRENIALVLQEPFLFPMSIAENIAFGNPEATEKEITDAARAAQAHDFIMRFPEGYNTILSETGASLSGGERQRIALARAFLKKASILILDEPTSAVDALTESKIFNALRKYSKGKTVFLISHRLSTLKHADQIITIKDGVIAERGTHQSLIDDDHVYADLYRHQHIG